MMTELNCWCLVEGDLLYLLLGFFPSLTSEEIILSDYIACESTFLAGRALLSSSLYSLVERKGNFSAVYCDMSVQFFPGPLCAQPAPCFNLV